MFTQLKATSRGRVTSLSTSLAIHGFFLLWLFQTSGPRVLAPSSLVAGDRGSFVTHLYWPSQPFEPGSNATSEASDEYVRQPMTKRTRLTWKPPSKLAKTAKSELPLSKLGADSTGTASDRGSQARPAGSPYGTLLQGPLTGDEVRPALPVFSPDPVVDPEDVGRVEGDVVVEISIDEQGNIVQRVAIQSLGPAIDQKVLAALENWRFRPATQNGVAIPSKQDVYYHFKATKG